MAEVDELMRFCVDNWHTAIYSMGTQNWHMAQKYAIIFKKSTIFTQFFWDLVKITISLVRRGLEKISPTEK